MAAKARRKSKNRARSAGNYRSRTKRRNVGTKVIFMTPKSKNRKRRNGRRRTVKINHRRGRNPTFFGSNASPMQMGQYILGGLIGVTVNRIVLPMLPSNITSSNTFSTLSAFGLAALEWWLANFISKDFGAAVGFGALMNAATQGLNAFVPSVGTTLGLSGRAMGDFVPGKYTVPQNPILDANGGVAGTGVAMRSSYPPAYSIAA